MRRSAVSDLRVRCLATEAGEVCTRPVIERADGVDPKCLWDAQLKKTGLYDFHVENGAKMVPFAGYSMPVSYGNVGAVASHHHVRKSVGLFDVGHMVQSKYANHAFCHIERRC